MVNYVSDRQFYALQLQVFKSRAAALSLGTKRNIQSQLRAYLLFTTYFQLEPFPVTFKNLTVYIQLLANSFKAPTSILNYLSGLRTVHKMLDLEFPELSSFFIKLQLRGITKDLAHLPHQAAPVSPEILTQCYHLLNLADPQKASAWACFLIAFFSFSRLGNLLPVSQKQFDPKIHLTRQDIFVAADGILILIKWTKTIQDGSRYLLLPLVAIPEHNLCPLQAVKHMLKLSPAPGDAPAFSYRNGPVLHTLTHSQLVELFRVLLQTLGLEASLYSGHSFRRAGASFAFQAGVRSELIQAQGDWKSLSYLQYLSFTPQQKQMVSAQMAQAIQLGVQHT
jgi:hypothetical protein